MDEKHMKELSLNKYSDANSEQENKYSMPKETYQINGVSVGHLVPNEEYVVIQKKYVDELKRKLELAKKALQFYANENNWLVSATNDFSVIKRTILKHENDTESYSYQASPESKNIIITVAGNLAREALNEIES